MSLRTQEPLEEYVTTIQDLAAVVLQIAIVEEKKAQIAADRLHEQMDGCIQEEQALILKLRGLEQHRIKYQDALGFDSLTLEQIRQQASPEQLSELSPAFSELETQLNRLEHARKAAEQMIQVRLHEIEVFAQQGHSYDNGGNVTPANAPQTKFHNKYV